MHSYHAHGLTILSEIGLALPPAASPIGRPDLTLRWGLRRAIPAYRPPGSVLAELTSPDGTLSYSVGRDPDWTVLRYPGLCDFAGDPNLTTVAAHLDPSSDPGLVAVLAAGALLAVHLMLRHELVLHASAIQRGNSVVAFVGASGMGKSTLAAALCEAGYALVADDLLRVASTGNGVMLAYPGSTESRLRKTARGLADAAPDDHVHTTADGRLALRSRTTSVGPLPLAVCVIPRPCQAAVEVSVNRLRPARGLARLMQFPRVVGWSESQSMGATFQSLADLVEQVPVFEATIPWGPPFQPEVLTGLLEAVMVDRSVSS